MHPALRLALATALAPLIGAAEPLRLPVTADTSIAASWSAKADDDEQAQNAGGAARIKMKGIENFLLLDVDAAPLKGQVVESAVLHIRGTDAKLMVRKVGCSTVATAWKEGAGSYAPAKPGEATWLSPGTGDGALWAGPGSNFLDAVGSRGGTIWAQAIAVAAADQWYEIPVDGRLLEACAAGLSHGIELCDDNGQTMNIPPEVDPQTNHSNNFFFAREQSNAAPWFAVTVAPAPAVTAAALAVKAAPWPVGAAATTGGLEITWPGPADEAARGAVLGYVIGIGGEDGATLPRWQVPTVPPAGEMVRALLRDRRPDENLSLTVSVIGRGGAVIATGRAAGKASPAAPATRPLALAPLAEPAAGAPPADAAGAVWAVPDLVKVNPITGNVLEEDGVAYAGEAKGAYARANPAWSGAERTVALAAVRNEWVAFQLVCQDVAPEARWSIVPRDLIGPDGATIPASAVRLSRLWYQRIGDGERAWYADPMLPLAAGEAFQVPDPRNAVPGQRNQTVYAEIFVPRDARPGAYRGAIDVATGGGQPIAVAIELAVAAATIPDQASFVLSMNAYGSPGDLYGTAGDDAFVAAERSFYVLAHEHRTNLAVLGYSQGGNLAPGFAWPLTGSGAEMRSADWSAFDRRWGPLFDGSAFAGTARAGVPLDHFYLPFHENWPTPMASGYRWNDLPWEDHWKKAGPVEEGFSREVREQWIATMKDLDRHIAEKRWRTNFQVYLNDKYFYKQYDPKQKKHGYGTSFWLLDEPQHFDDYLALAFFGGLTRQASPRGSRIVFRCDVSRPEWGRDTLDRVLDVNVSGGFAAYRPWLEDWRARHGQRIWTYGGTPTADRSAFGIEHQIIDLTSRGVEGYVPWLVLGDEGSWTRHVDTCVLYTGKPMGIAGACASLRLKAYRRGEQDAEYLLLAAGKLGPLAEDPDRARVAALLGSAIGGSKQLGQLDAQGAITESFAGAHPEDFERLRRTIAAQQR